MKPVNNSTTEKIFVDAKSNIGAIGHGPVEMDLSDLTGARLEVPEK